MDAGFIQKMLSYVQTSGGISPVSAKIYYANTSGSWLNSTAKIAGYTDKSTGFDRLDVVGGKDTSSSKLLVDWGSVVGANWTSSASLGFTSIYAAAYGTSKYVVGGASGSIATSTNGSTWTSGTGGLGSNQHLSISFLNSLFVATGFSGSLGTSPDGTTWTPQTSSFGSSDVRECAYGAATYVAVGATGKIATSPDAVTWTQRTNTFGTTLILGVTFGSSKFVAVGGAGKLATSPDGITWTAQTSSFGTTDIYGVDYNGSNLFVAVGDTGKIATSPDAVIWTQRTSPVSTKLTKVKYLAGKWVCCGDAGVVMTSPDGITWTNWQTNTPFYSGPVSVYALASNGTDIIASGEANYVGLSQAGAFVSDTTLAGVIVDLLGTGAVGSLLPFSDASTPFYTAGTAPPTITAGQITLAYGGSASLLGDYLADLMLTGVDDGVASGTGYLNGAFTCGLLSAYTSPSVFTEITAAQYSAYTRKSVAITVSSTTLSNTASVFIEIYGSSATAPTITHAAIFDSSSRIVTCLPLPTPIARTDYIRDITIPAGAMQLILNPTQTSTPV